MSTTKTEVVTGEARLSYCKIWEPETNEDGIAKYSVCVMIPKKDKATLENVRNAIAAAMEAGKASKFGGKLAGVKNPLRDGDEEDEEGERVRGAEFKGMMFFNASGRKQPIILDRSRNEVINKAEVYSGVWANVAINFYPYNADKSKGVAAGLNAIRKLRDDENLGGGITADAAVKMFDEVEEDEI